MAREYTGANIKRFAGLAGVRKRSSVYIGPNDSNGLWTILREPSDNFLDLATKGWNKKGTIVLDPNGKGYWVIDEGPGFPVEMKVFEDEQGREEELNTFFVATGLTHAGSNFDSDETSRGVNGVGIKCTNAMSKLFKAWTFRKTWYNIEYRDARLHSKVAKSDPPKLPFGIKPTKGSVIYFEPDMSLFMKDTKLDIQDLISWATISSYLVPQAEITVYGRNGKSKTFKTKGLPVYLNDRLDELDADEVGKFFICQEDNVDVALAFSDAEGNCVRCYTNGLLNVGGGTHADAVYKALMNSLKPYKGKMDFVLKDIQDGLVGLLNVKLSAPMFDSQVKNQLIDKRATDVCYEPVYKAFVEFWKKNKTMAVTLCKRAAELRKKTVDFSKDKQLMKKVKNASKKMSTKLADISGSRVPLDQRELFLVEGDSAAGTGKKARFKDFQAIFALRGKPLNVMDAAKDKINNNAEIAGILAAIGLDSGKELRYGRFIFLADPDVDGPLSGDTKVALLGGAVETIEALYNRVENGEQVVVRSRAGGADTYSTATGAVRVVVSSYLRIVLNDDTTLEMTKCHRQPLVNGEKRAEALVVGDVIPGDRATYEIMDIQEVKEEKEFFCLVVPETSNFYIKSSTNENILTGNCHITTLLMTAFWKFFPNLYEEGRIFMVKAPEYYAQIGKELVFGGSVEEVVKKAGKQVDVRHIKGWGELDAWKMVPMAFDKKTRILQQVMPPSSKEEEKEFEQLMGSNSEYRQRMLGVSA